MAPIKYIVVLQAIMGVGFLKTKLRPAYQLFFLLVGLSFLLYSQQEMRHVAPESQRTPQTTYAAVAQRVQNEYEAASHTMKTYASKNEFKPNGASSKLTPRKAGAMLEVSVRVCDYELGAHQTSNQGFYTE